MRILLVCTRYLLAVFLLLGVGFSFLCFGQSSPKNRLALHVAAENDDIAEVQRLLKSGAKINELDQKGWMPIHLASMKGNTQIVELLLSNGASVDSRSEKGSTPLYVARSLEMAKLLLDHGADVNAENYVGLTPLHIVENKEQAALLIARKANILARDKYGKSPLHNAAFAARREIVELLLQGGADPNSRTSEGKTPLDLCWSFAPGDDPAREDTALIMIKASATITSDMSDQQIALIFKATSRGEVRIIQYLFDRGWSVRSRDKNGQTLLHVAGNAKTVELLIAKGADIRDKDQAGRSPLHLAASQRNAEIAKALINHGADVNSRDSNGDTPLHYAAACGELGIASKIVEAGGDINSKNYKGSRPFDVLLRDDSKHRILESESTAFLFPDDLAQQEADRLLDKKNDLFSRKDSTPLHEAVRTFHTNTVKFMLSRGVDVNVLDNSGQTALHLAVSERMLRIAKLLIDNGARCDIQDKQSKTPMDIAQRSDFADIIDYLRQNCPTH